MRNEPQQVAPPAEPKGNVQPLAPPEAPVKVQAQDVLLAIIHGYQAAGWRNSAAQQTYLLRNAVGANMHVEGQRSLHPAGQEKLPHLRGDIIATQLNHKPGFIYFTGARYAWYATATK